MLENNSTYWRFTLVTHRRRRRFSTQMNPQQANKLKQEYMEVRTKPQYKVYFVNKNITKWHVSMLSRRTRAGRTARTTRS